MREFLALCLALSFFVISSVSFVAIIRPLPKLWLGTRKKALQGLGASFLLLILAMFVIPPVEEETGGDAVQVADQQPQVEVSQGKIATADSQIAKVQVTEMTSYASIQVDLKASWSEKDMPTQAAMVIEEVGKVLKKGAAEIPPEIERINFWFTYPMIDRYGNESRSQIFNITFKADELRKVNYGKVPTNQVLDLGSNFSFGGMAGREAAAAYCGDDGRSWSPVFCREVVAGLRY